MTPYVDTGGFLWLRRTFETTAPQVERILILREADNYAIELSVQHADWLQAMNISVWDYRLAHDPSSGRQLPFETFHAKILLSDDSLAYVGSANFLGSSEAFTLEAGMLIDGRAVAQIARLIEAVLRVARRI
jgi:phosphatidylserine/phosphatidylglycerophosphate/cardiolipin synthase-like enzyme